MTHELQIDLANDLRLALLAQRFHLVFQPKIDLKTEKVIGAEVLLRWLHPTHGLVPADKWVEIAESHGLMSSLTKWLVTQVIAILKTWQHQDISLSINVSPTCLNGEFAEFVLKTLKENDVSPSLLEIEVTETATVSNLKNVAASARWLRSHGVKISLDDFGAGYATMKYLVEIEVDSVKIDKSFIQQAPQNPAARLVLRSLIDLAKEIDLSIVCEGVETLEQLELVTELGADMVQGFYFSQPMSLSAFTRKNNQLAIIGLKRKQLSKLRKAS